MRILIFHGYLLDGTGSNVYNARLAAALAAQGHDVHLLCQERAPELLPFVAAAGDWDSGRLEVAKLRSEGGVTTYRPDIGGRLPVYVADAYEGFEARPFAEFSDQELADYVAANVAAVAEVAERVRPDVALANHLVMGPLVLARGLAPSGVPYAVKVHGSALEYTVKPNPERFLDAAREGLAQARCVLVGSRHTAESLWAALDDPGLPTRTRLGPPGVDIEQFGPRAPAAARAGLQALRDAVVVEPAAARGDDAFARDPAAAAAALARLDPERDRLVAFVGKLIVSKGVDLLVAAWPLVLAAEPAARLVIVGFGAYREGVERLIAALSAGDLEEARAVAEAGWELEGGPRAPLGHLLAFLDTLDADGDARAAYLAAAAGAGERIVLTGRLEHDQLAELLPACEAQVVPSTFPEAFGMVAAEAAACGVLPVSADHSGLAEVTHVLAGAVPAEAAPWLSFRVGPGAVRDLAGCMTAWLDAGDAVRARTREGLVATARARFSWTGVADGVIAAAEGRLDALSPP